MLKDITKILNKIPGLKGREIAKRLGVEKKVVNSFLAKNHEGLYQDDNYGWYVIDAKIHKLSLNSEPWVTADSFEEDLQSAGCFFDSSADNFIIEFPKNCQILLIAGARIIATANQLAGIGKNITLDFKKSAKLKNYLNRLGFFDHLEPRVSVLPKKPADSKAKKFKGKSDSLVEIAQIDTSNLDNELPKRLTEKFVHNASQDYYMAAFTIFSELIDNVQQHSKTKLPGFAALQKYGGIRPHIQTVVSDNGLGISETLKQNLKKYYPDIYEKYNLNELKTDIYLVKEALTKGGLSQFGPDAERGLGLKRSQDYAVKFNAIIVVRQKTFELKLVYKDGSLFETFYKKDLPIINGSQICFDFFLD